MSYDVLSQLLEASWRSIPVPTLNVGTKGGHRVVLHARQDRDGERGENTGRKGYAFTFKIPFINSLSRGRNETWKSLYPDTYRRFVEALEDRTTGALVHPDYGIRQCKAIDWETTLDPTFRGGPTLTVGFNESVDAGDAFGLGATSAVPIALAAAVDLDTLIYGMSPPPDTGTPGGQSLTDFIKGLGSIVDEWQLAQAQWEAAFNRVGYTLSGLAEKFGAVPGFSDATQRLISSLHAMRAQALGSAKSTSVYVVPRAATVPAIAQRLKSSVGDLIKLNPALAKGPVVPAETVVRYYA